MMFFLTVAVLIFSVILVSANQTSIVTKENTSLRVEKSSIQQILLNQETLVRLELEKKVKSLENDVANLKKENENIKQDIADQLLVQEKKLTDIKSQLNESVALRASVEDLDTRYTRISKNLTEYAKQIAFEARMTSSSQGSKRSTLIFDHVTLNHGNGYSNVTGKFTAPMDGLYVFGWHILAVYRKVTHTALMVNGKEVSAIYCHTKGTDGHQPCSKMTLVNLALGDTVWIAYTGAGDYHTNAYYSSFNGVKI